MADIRINALATTATTPASDDYLALDGAAQGTRKILATNIANNVTDVILGSSGPSVKSSLSARAPRQGLVFDGSAGATVTIPVVGTADFSVNFWVTPNTSVAYAAMLASPNGGIYLTSLTPKILNESSAVVVAANAALSLGKTSHVTYTRSGTTGTWYINGVAAGSGTDSTNYSVAWSYIGSTLVGTIGGLNLYNRALSASEVVALYEAGAPAGADYNSASNTAINTSAWANYSNPTYAYQSFTSASATGFTASNSTNPASGLSVAVMAPQVTTFRAGTRYLVTFTATLTSGEAPKLRIGDSAGKSNEHTVTAGSNSVVLTTTSSVTATENIIFFNTLATSFSVSSVSVTRLGLLLAPDAAQAGGGLVWYDTSGNAANITLPASGVSWNVPSSQKTASGWTFAGPIAADSTSTTAAVSGTSTGSANMAEFGITSQSGRAFLYRSDAIGLIIGSAKTAAAQKPIIFATGSDAADRYMTLTGSGNLLIGTTIDGGQKLQVSGTAAIAGNLTVTGDIIAASGYVFRSLGHAYLDSNTGKDVYLRTNGGTLALTLDSSQNATFAGDINLKSVVTTPTVKNILAAGNYSGTNNILNSRCQMGADTNGDYGAWFGASYDGAQIHNWIGTRNNGIDYTLIDLMGGGSPLVKLGGALRLNNAYTAGAPTATGYVTIQDSGGNTYKVLVGT